MDSIENRGIYQVLIKADKLTIQIALEKYTLTIEEAAKYFRIGEKKLRQLADEHPNANWLIMNGNRVQIKRKQFEKMIDSMEVI